MSSISFYLPLSSSISLTNEILKRIVLFLLLFCCITVSAQQMQRKKVKVTTRNGVSYVGFLEKSKTFDYVRLDVGEKFLQISFKDMAYIDEVKPESEPVKVVEPEPEPTPVLVPVAEPEPETVAEPAPEPAKVAEPESKPASKFANFHGFLLESGNNVCLTSISNPKNTAYDQAAVDVLTRQLRRDGFWHIVENPEEAHFILNCVVNLNDGKASIGISSDLTGGNEYLGTLKGAEDVTEYRKLVWELYNKYVIPMQRKIEKGSISSHTRKNFTAD